ncbi:MAG: hypothetical protein E7543_00695 [Ruminococcaceae bacterium]|nr:hypothetical protein [Oscillospiraceae bacterium]
MTKKDKPKSKKTLPDHAHNFHRQHMRERFYEAGFKGMADHNVLEMLLYFGIPRKDTNGIAHELISTFGSFSSVFEANRHDLLKVKGMTETAVCLIKMMLPVYSRYTDSLKEHRPSPIEPEEVYEYLLPKYFEGSCRERVYVLCYDSSDRLIACRLLNEGDICSSSFDIREFSRIVLETNCTSVIISHNHPHCFSQPSKDDIRVTQNVIKLLDMLKIRLIDHIIVADDGYTSLANHRYTLPLFYPIDELEFVAEEKNLD